MSPEIAGQKIVMFPLCPLHGSSKRDAQDGWLAPFCSARFHHSRDLLTMQADRLWRSPEVRSDQTGDAGPRTSYEGVQRLEAMECVPQQKKDSGN